MYGSGTRSGYAVPNSKMNMCARRFNFYSLNDEFSVVSEGVRKSDREMIRQRVLSKEIPDDVLSAIRTIRVKKSSFQPRLSWRPTVRKSCRHLSEREVSEFRIRYCASCSL